MDQAEEMSTMISCMYSLQVLGHVEVMGKRSLRLIRIGWEIILDDDVKRSARHSRIL